MRTARWSTPARLSSRALLGLALGALAGALLAALAGAPDSRSDERTATPRAPAIEVTHVPRLLTAPDEPIELAYDAYCLPADGGEEDAPCDAAGSVYLRSGEGEAFTEIPLDRGRTRAEGRLVARVPARFARSPRGFEYYAVIGDRATGASTTLPAGGAESPQRSIPLGRGVEIDLGAHRFGVVRAASERVAAADWGDGPLDIGLEQGRNLPPIGGASFDVSADGSIYVLDEAHRRALRWQPGQARPAAIDLAIDGTIADLAVAPDRLYVLETVAAPGRNALLRAFSATGRTLAASQLAEPAYRVRIGPNRVPVTLHQTSSQWVQTEAVGRAAAPTRAPRHGRPGQPLPDGREVVVLRTQDEIRVALLSSRGAPRSWRIRSDTPLAEVQLAEPLGARLVLVTRVYTDTRGEFLVLVLGPGGVEARFALPSNDWAETAPLSRFRLVGSSLYQLGSTPDGLFVDRYDLEVT
jgi:hypothetical protein